MHIPLTELPNFPEIPLSPSDYLLIEHEGQAYKIPASRLLGFEVTAREQSEAILQANIAAEAHARELADNALTTYIDNKYATITVAKNSENIWEITDGNLSDIWDLTKTVLVYEPQAGFHYMRSYVESHGDSIKAVFTCIDAGRHTFSDPYGTYTDIPYCGGYSFTFDSNNSGQSAFIEYDTGTVDDMFDYLRPSIITIESIEGVWTITDGNQADMFNSDKTVMLYHTQAGVYYRRASLEVHGTFKAARFTDIHSYIAEMVTLDVEGETFTFNDVGEVGNTTFTFTTINDGETFLGIDYTFTSAESSLAYICANTVAIERLQQNG